MQKDLVEAEPFGNETGVLTACTAETVHYIVFDVITARDGYLLDCLCHVLDGNFEKAFGDIFGTAIIAHGGGNVGKSGERRIAVERLVLIGTENVREIVRLQLTETYIDVRHSEFAAATITNRTRIRTCRIRAYAETMILELQKPPCRLLLS